MDMSQINSSNSSTCPSASFEATSEHFNALCVEKSCVEVLDFRVLGLIFPDLCEISRILTKKLTFLVQSHILREKCRILGIFQINVHRAF